MIEIKRQRYIRLLSKALSDISMENVHEIILTKKANKEIVEILKADEETKLLRGHWISVDEQEDAFDCSECDAMVMRRYNFCPKCGADMRGDHNG